MTGRLNSIGAITLFVDDLDRSAGWYRATFELEVVFADEDSTVLRFDNTILNLLRTSAAHELIEPATVATRGTGARFQLTIWVDDVDAACADLGQRGVAMVNGP